MPPPDRIALAGSGKEAARRRTWRIPTAYRPRRVANPPGLLHASGSGSSEPLPRPPTKRLCGSTASAQAIGEGRRGRRRATLPQRAACARSVERARAREARSPGCRSRGSPAGTGRCRSRSAEPALLLDQLHRDAEQADDAAGRDEAARVERARARLVLALRLFPPALDEPAHDAAAEDRGGGADRRGSEPTAKLSERTPSSSTAITRNTPSSTRPQGSLRFRMPLMTTDMRRACGAGASSLPMPWIHCTSILPRRRVQQVLALGDGRRSR